MWTCESRNVKDTLFTLHLYNNNYFSIDWIVFWSLFKKMKWTHCYFLKILRENVIKR